MRTVKEIIYIPDVKIFSPPITPYFLPPALFLFQMCFSRFFLYTVKRQSVAQIPRVVLFIIQQSPMALHFTVAATLQVKIHKEKLLARTSSLCSCVIRQMFVLSQ